MKSKNLGSNWEEFKKELNKKQPWHIELYRQIRRIFIVIFDFIYYFPQEIKFAYQRVRYGLCDRDIWNFDTHLAKIIALGVSKLGIEKEGFIGGYPSTKNKNGQYTFSKKRWNKILKQIEEGFTIYAEDDIIKQRDFKNQAKMDKSFELLKEYYGSMWD